MYKNRVKFVWDPFVGEETIRLAGSVKVSFSAAIDRQTAILSAMLVDLGEDRRITAEEVACGDDSFCFGLEAEPSSYKVISRGWLNAQNRTCLWSKEAIVPGETYSYHFEMVPTDHTLKKGHKLALILYGIDAEETQRPDTVTKISVDVSTIQIEVPLLRS